MIESDDKKPHDPYLRAAAERRLAETPLVDATAASTQELLHELQVHQIELEMQNESLRQAQMALAESRDRYVDLYEFAPVGYLTLTSAGLIEEINLTGVKLLGVERKRLMLRRFTSLVIPVDQERWMHHFLSVKNREGKVSAELALQRGDGTVFQAQLDCACCETSSSGKEGEEKSLGVRIALTDISERKRMDDALRESECNMSEAQEIGCIGSYVYDIPRNVWRSSAMLDTIFGIGNDFSRTSTGWAQIIHPAEREQMISYLQEIIATHQRFDKEYRIVRVNDGAERWMLCRGKVEYGSDDIAKNMKGTVQDITGRKLAEADLDKYRDHLEEIVRERTSQMNNLTTKLVMAEERDRREVAQNLHDNLCQILATIKLKCSSLKAPGDDERRVNLQRKTQELDELVDSANRSARSLSMQLSPPILSQQGLIPALEWLAEEMHYSHGLDICIQCADNPPMLAETVSITLFRIVRELLLNVSKYAGVDTAEVTIQTEDDKLVITVADDGIGFVFDEIPSPSISGGYGLFSVNERMRFMEGEMKIDTGPDKGTLVVLTMPLQVHA